MSNRDARSRSLSTERSSGKKSRGREKKTRSRSRSRDKSLDRALKSRDVPRHRPSSLSPDRPHSPGRKFSHTITYMFQC